MADAIEGQANHLKKLVKEFVSELINELSSMAMDIQQNGKKKQQRRGLPNNKNTVDALKCLKEEKIFRDVRSFRGL